MNDPEEHAITSDEKLVAALSHFFGPIAGIIVWAMYKDKSRFVRFQALQSLSFDISVMVGMMIVMFCGFAIIFIGGFGVLFAGLNNASSPADLEPYFLIPFMFPFSIFLCITPFTILITAARIIASISILSGRDFRYPVLGKWVERFLEK